MVKILHLQCRTCEFDPSWENLRYHVPHCQKQKGAAVLCHLLRGAGSAIMLKQKDSDNSHVLSHYTFITNLYDFPAVDIEPLGH